MLRRWRDGDGQLRLRVELADDSQWTMRASRTSLGAPSNEVPTTRGRAADYLSLLYLEEALERGHRGPDGQDGRSGRGAARTA